jgi:transposase-like protein
LSQFFCWNEDCPDYGIKNQGNIFLKERYGKNQHALLKCKTCKRCFSETRGTVFFELNTSEEEVLRTLAMIPEKGSIRGVAELLDIVKTQFVDGSRLQELIQKKLQLISSQILILRELRLMRSGHI